MMLGFTGNGQPLSVHKTLDITYSSTDEELWINSCTCDVRTLRPGDLFVAIANDQYDGYSQIEQAQLCGCKAVLVERKVPGLKVPYFIVNNTQEAFGILCQKIYGNPADSMRVIAVTGTSGKTCTTFLIAGMLAESGNRVGVVSSMGIYDGEKMYPCESSTPPANELAYWFFKMRESGCTDVVLEVSSDAIDRYHLSGITLDAVCLTNIRTDHLDYHQTIENYRRSKLAIFRHAKESAIAVCNGDDSIIRAILPLIQNPVLTIGIEEIADINGMLFERTNGDQTFMITAGMETIPARTRIIGDGQILNCLLAVGYGVSRGIDLKKAIRGLERVDNIPGRMERIDCGQSFNIFLDSAQTKEALTTTFQAVREITKGNIYCVFGTSSHDDAEKLRQLGETLEHHVDHLILTADSLTAKYSEPILRMVLSGMESPGLVRKFRGRSDAIAWALSRIEPEDTLLVISGSHDLSLDIPDDDVNLSDRGLIKEWLYENQQPSFMP